MAQYLKKNGKDDYITDIVDIEAARLNNLRHTIIGCMLGDFDDTGRYVMSKEIVKELISMPKFIIDSVDNIDICHGELVLDKSITFAVSFEVDRATLSLLEKVNYGANFKLNSGIYSDVIETVLDSVDTSGVVDRNVIYRMWHISSFGGNRLDILSCGEDVLRKYFGITGRFDYLMRANKVLLDKEKELEEIEAEYALAVLGSMEVYPEFRAAVLESVRKTIFGKPGFVRKDKPNYAKTYNELLENAIEANLGMLTDEQREQFLIDKQNALRDKNVKVADTLKVESVLTDSTKDGSIVYSLDGKVIAGSGNFTTDLGITSEQLKSDVSEVTETYSNFKVEVKEKKTELYTKNGHTDSVEPTKSQEDGKKNLLAQVAESGTKRTSVTGGQDKGKVTGGTNVKGGKTGGTKDVTKGGKGGTQQGVGRGQAGPASSQGNGNNNANNKNSPGKRRGFGIYFTGRIRRTGSTGATAGTNSFTAAEMQDLQSRADTFNSKGANLQATATQNSVVGNITANTP